jgi:hypothetical protein
VTRKQCRRRVIAPMPPRGLRPKLDRDQVTDLALAHMTNLDLISKGHADEGVLWQMVGGVFTWSRAADLLQIGVPEMRAQLELATRVVERYGRTGRVGFSGTEYQVAKLGVDVMDQLAEMVDKATALAAAEWGEAQVNALSAACSNREPAGQPC